MKILASWVVLFLAVMLAALLSGCASTGITISAAEEKECQMHGCTVWTETELRGLIQQVFREAYRLGGKAAI